MKNSDNYDIDKKIRRYLNNESQNIHVPDDLFYKIKNEIYRKNERGFLNMKIGFLKMKTALISVALVLATTASVGAATGQFSWITSSDPRNEIKTYPTEATVEDTVGFTPKYVESFDGGFKFDSFNFSNQEIKDDTGNTVSKNKNANFYYNKEVHDKNQYLAMSAEKIDEEYFNSDEEKDNEEMSEYNGLKIYYNSFKYKSVPEGYTPTSEEKEEVDAGTLQIGYGASDEETSIENMQSVSWYEDGTSYNILNSNYDEVSKENMINMAKTVIDK